MNEDFNDDTFILYAAKHYDNPHCFDINEFYDDLKRFKYLKRLFIKYKDNKELKERLILNHIIILYNVFGSATTRMLFTRLDGLHQYLKPFVMLLGHMPERIRYKGIWVYNSDIPMDKNIVDRLRNI